MPVVPMKDSRLSWTPLRVRSSAVRSHHGVSSSNHADAACSGTSKPEKPSGAHCGPSASTACQPAGSDLMNSEPMIRPHQQRKHDHG